MPSPGTCSRRCKGKKGGSFRACQRRCMKGLKGLGRSKRRRRKSRRRRRRR